MRLGAVSQPFLPSVACLVAAATALSILPASAGDSASGDAAEPAKSSPAARPRVARLGERIPLAFEPNQGQTDERVKFLSRGKGYTLFLTGDEAVLSLKKPSAVSGQPSAGRTL